MSTAAMEGFQYIMVKVKYSKVNVIFNPLIYQGTLQWENSCLKKIFSLNY